MSSRFFTCLLLLFAPVSLMAFDLDPVPGKRPPDPKVAASLSGNRLQVTYSVPAGYHMVRQEEFLTFSVETEDYRIGKIEYPAGKKGKSGEEEYKDEFTISAVLERTAAVEKAAKSIPVKAAWQMCDEEGTCLMPADTVLTVTVDPALIPEAGGTKPAPAVGPAPPALATTADAKTVDPAKIGRAHV